MSEQAVLGVFIAARRYKQENEALRSLLRDLGMSDKKVGEKLKAILRGRKKEDSALEMLTLVCVEALRSVDKINDIEVDSPQRKPQ